MEHSETPPKTKSKPIWYILLGSLGVLVVAAGLVVFLLTKGNHASPFPKEVREKVDFPLYYPSQAPPGWEVTPSSISATPDVVTYEVLKAPKARFLVSIQPYPNDFDYLGFKKKFVETDEFTSTVGTVFMGEVGNSLVVSIRTIEGAWILINTSDAATRPLATELSRYFVKTP